MPRKPWGLRVVEDQLEQEQKYLAELEEQKKAAAATIVRLEVIRNRIKNGEPEGEDF